MPSFPHLLRVANRLRDALQLHARGHSDVDTRVCMHLESVYNSVLKNRCQMGFARRKDWPACVSGLRLERVAYVKRLQSAVNELTAMASEPASTLPTLSDVMAELRHLEQEFGDLRIHWKERSMSVTTETVTLEDIELGPFSICLYWPRLTKGPSVECFEIVALDPNPATVNDEVTHPHVRDRELCAGEATVPIKRALEQGRFVDAFLLVRGVLTSYNPNSVHVSLDNWEGYTCADCGQIVSDNDRAYCEACDCDFCDECTTCCHVCGHGRCRGCLDPCADCDELCCPSCLHASASSKRECCQHCLVPCEECGARVARSELDDSECCPTCRETAEVSHECDPVTTPEVPHESTAIP